MCLAYINILITVEKTAIIEMKWLYLNILLIKEGSVGHLCPL